MCDAGLIDNHPTIIRGVRALASDECLQVIRLPLLHFTALKKDGQLEAGDTLGVTRYGRADRADRQRYEQRNYGTRYCVTYSHPMRSKGSCLSWTR